MEAADATESKDSTNVSEGGDLPSGMGSVASSLSSRGDESSTSIACIPRRLEFWLRLHFSFLTFNFSFFF